MKINYFELIELSVGGLPLQIFNLLHKRISASIWFLHRHAGNDLLQESSLLQPSFSTGAN